MGLWFFLAVVVLANIAFKAYKMRLHAKNHQVASNKVTALELELKAIREKIQHLDEAVFFSDFELKRQFRELEKNTAQDEKPNVV
jgi:hypothetical protein